MIQRLTMCFFQPARAARNVFLLACCLLGCLSCAPKKTAGRSVAVFIPGQLEGSAIYSQLAAGTARAVREQPGARILIVEAGFNQAEWEAKLTALAAQGVHDLIVTSNPAMPYFVDAIRQRFPEQHFLLMDAEMPDVPTVYSMRYNQREQAYMAGYLAALLSAADGSGDTRSIGLLAAQEYPAMTGIIRPAYLEGAAAAAADEGRAALSLDYRVVGNWFDAQKAAELSRGMLQSGARVILTIAGSANEGAVQAAAESGAKVLWFDSNGYAVRPGVVAGSSALMQEQAVYDKLKLYFENRLPFGTAETAGLEDGYVRFIDDDPLYIQTVAPEIREKQARMIEKIQSGGLVLD